MPVRFDPPAYIVSQSVAQVHPAFVPPSFARTLVRVRSGVRFRTDVLDRVQSASCIGMVVGPTLTVDRWERAAMRLIVAASTVFRPPL